MRRTLSVHEQDRWHTVDRKRLRQAGYDPFYGTGEVVKAMWREYHANAPPRRAASDTKKERL